MVARNIYCFKEHTHLQDQDQPPSKIAFRYACLGKNIRWDPTIPTWDPRCVPGGIPPFSGGIPGGIMEHPAWDPTWDYGTSRMGSHLGLWNIPHGIPPGIMEHPAWDPTRDPALNS